MTLIDVKHKLLLCTTPKAGSTNWRVTFDYLLNYKEDDTDHGHNYKNEVMPKKFTSKKDKIGYRIRRNSATSLMIQTGNEKSNEIVGGIPKFPFSLKYLREDVSETFVFDGRNSSKSQLGLFTRENKYVRGKTYTQKRTNIKLNYK